MTSWEADGAAREWVLACIDNSGHANSVTDHAGWFASHPEVGVDLLHVVDPSQAPKGGALADRKSSTDALADALIDRAIGRLREEGVGPIRAATGTGSLVEAALRHEAGPIVVGKRGAGSGAERRRLGSHANAIVHRSPQPVCLAPKVFLPIHRALVVLDADVDHRTALEFVASDFRLSALPLNVAIVAGAGEDPDPKVEWARGILSRCSAEIFPLVGMSVDDAVALCMESKGADMLVLSRTVAACDLENQVLRIEERGLWGTRIPVLIS
jgi:nucleotide-binding universal stress UspA family protein